LPIVSSEHRLLSGFAAPRTACGCALDRRSPPRREWSSARLLITLLVALACFGATADSAQAQSDISYPQVDVQQPVLFGGDDATCWTKGEFEVWVLRGRCYVQQGPMATEAKEAVLWVRRTTGKRSRLDLGDRVSRRRCARRRWSRRVGLRDARPYMARRIPIERGAADRTPPPKPAPDVLPQVFGQRAGAPRPTAAAAARPQRAAGAVHVVGRRVGVEPYAPPVVLNVPPVGAPPITPTPTVGAPAAVVAQAQPYGQPPLGTQPIYTPQPNVGGQSF